MTEQASDRGPRDAGSLLDEIAERALDDDYYLVRPGRYSRSRQFTSMATAVMLGIFALMVTIAAVQSRQDRPATALERQALEADVKVGREQLDARQSAAKKLRTEVALLESALDRDTPGRALAHLFAGDQRVSGPGVLVRLDPGEQDIDDTAVQGLVNALWAAGAEAVAVNGNRIAALSSIGQAKGLVTVNFRSIGAPYVFGAIGDPDTLQDRFEDSKAAEYWASRTSAEFSVRTESELHLDAVPRTRSEVRHAEVVKGAS